MPETPSACSHLWDRIELGSRRFGYWRKHHSFFLNRYSLLSRVVSMVALLRMPLVFHCLSLWNCTNNGLLVYLAVERI